MDITSSRFLFERALSDLSNVYAQGTKLDPASQAVLLATDEQALNLSCYDHDLAMLRRVPVDVAVPGSTLLDGKTLTTLVKTVGLGENISLKAQRTKVAITAGPGTATISPVAGEHPSLPQHGIEVVLPCKEFLQALKTVAWTALDAKYNTPTLNAIHLKTSLGHLSAEATDRTGYMGCEIPAEFDEQIDLLLPSRFVTILLKLKLGQEFVSLFVNKNRATLVWDAGSLSTTVVAGTYPDTSRFSPRITQTVEVNSVELLNALEPFAALGTCQAHLQFVAKSEELYLSGHSLIGDTMTYLHAIGIKDDIKLALDPAVLKAAIEHLDCNILEIQIEGPTSPVVLEPATESDWKRRSIIMTCALQEPKLEVA